MRDGLYNLFYTHHRISLEIDNVRLADIKYFDRTSFLGSDRSISEGHAKLTAGAEYCLPRGET